MTTSSALYRASYIPSSNLGNLTVETQFLDARNNQITLPLPWNGTLADTSFYLRASGRVVTTSSISFAVALYFGLSKTISSNVLMYGSGPIFVNGQSNWKIQTELYWDSSSNTINGTGNGQVAGSFLGQSALASSLSAVPLQSTTIPLQPLGFTITGLFGTSDPGNQAFVDNFELGLL